MFLDNLLLFQDGFFQGPSGSYLAQILLALLGAFLLGLLLGFFLWYPYRKRANELSRELEECKDKLAHEHTRANNLEAELSQTKYEKEKLQGEVASFRNKNATLDIQLKACNEQLNALKEELENKGDGGDT